MRPSLWWPRCRAPRCGARSEGASTHDGKRETRLGQMIRVPGSAPGSAPGRSSRAPVPLQGAPDGMERRSRSGSALERTWTRPVGRAPGTRTGSLAHLDGLAGRARGCRNRPRVPGARPTGRDRVRSRLLEPGAAGERSRSAPGRSRSAPGRSRTLPSRSRPGTPGARLEIGAPGPFQSRSRSAPGAGTGLQLSGAPLHTVGTATWSFDRETGRALPDDGSRPGAAAGSGDYLAELLAKDPQLLL